MSSTGYFEFSSPPESPIITPEMRMSPDILAAVGNFVIGVKASPHHRTMLHGDPNNTCHLENGLTKNSATSL